MQYIYIYSTYFGFPMFAVFNNVNFWYPTEWNEGDRGSTVVKVVCYKSEGRWFDPS